MLDSELSVKIKFTFDINFRNVECIVLKIYSAIVPVGRPRPSIIIILNMCLLLNAALTASSQIIASP